MIQGLWLDGWPLARNSILYSLRSQADVGAFQLYNTLYVGWVLVLLNLTWGLLLGTPVCSLVKISSYQHTIKFAFKRAVRHLADTWGNKVWEKNRMYCGKGVSVVDYERNWGRSERKAILQARGCIDSSIRRALDTRSLASSLKVPGFPFVSTSMILAADDLQLQNMIGNESSWISTSLRHDMIRFTFSRNTWRLILNTATQEEAPLTKSLLGQCHASIFIVRKRI